MKVRIATPLYSYTSNRSMVEAAGTTVDEAMKDLDRQFTGIRFRIIDEQDQIRPHIKIFLNGEQIRDLSTPTSAPDEIMIIQAFSGG